MQNGLLENWAHRKVWYMDHKAQFCRLHLLSTWAHRDLNKEEELDPNLPQKDCTEVSGLSQSWWKTSTWSVFKGSDPKLTAACLPCCVSSCNGSSTTPGSHLIWEGLTTSSCWFHVHNTAEELQPNASMRFGSRRHTTPRHKVYWVYLVLNDLSTCSH